MLSESVLEEFVRPSSLRQTLVEKAWPALSVESKLQIIQAIQNSDALTDSPAWLIDLGLADKEPIVRIWSTRFGHFPERLNVQQKTVLGEISDADTQRREKALTDPEPLVRVNVENQVTLLGYSEITELPQQERLWAIRTASHAYFESFIDWVEVALEKNIPPREIVECMQELFNRPGLTAELARTEHDGYSNYQTQKALEKGWELTKTAKPYVQNGLAALLPLKIGSRIEISAEILAQLPSNVLKTVLLRNEQNPGKELEKLKTMIHDSPEDFNQGVVKALEMAAELDDNHSEGQAVRALSSDITKETLDVLLDEVALLRDQLTKLVQAERPKKGFWG